MSRIGATAPHGYRLAVAAREDWSRPPPRGHRDWLRVAYAFEQGLAVERAKSRGMIFADRAAVEREAERWADAWHTRVIGVVRRLPQARP